MGNTASGCCGRPESLHDAHFGLKAYTYFDHRAWNHILSRFVSAAIFEDTTVSVVNYEAMASDGVVAELDKYLQQLAEAPLATMVEADQQALYINAYNALVIKSIVDHIRLHPGDPNLGAPTSPLARGDRAPSHVAWPGLRDFAATRRRKQQPLSPAQAEVNTFTRIAGTVGGVTYSLQGLEDMLSVMFGRDLRFYAALCQGSVSSPDLFTIAYSGQLLDSQLRLQTRHWLKNWRKGFARTEAHSVVMSISHVFDGLDLGPRLEYFLRTNHPNPKIFDTIPKGKIQFRYFKFVQELNIAPGSRRLSITRPIPSQMALAIQSIHADDS